MSYNDYEETRLENRIKLARKVFKNQIPHITKYDDVTIIDWRKANGERVYSANIIYKDNNVFISGDIGNAVFDLTWNAEIGTFKNKNLQYLTEKLKAINCSDDFYIFDCEQAKEYLVKEYIQDNGLEDNLPVSEMSLSDAANYIEEYRYDNSEMDDETELFYELWDMTEFCSSCNVWRNQLESLSQKYDTDLYSLDDIGDTYLFRIILYIVALQMIDEYVEKHDMKTECVKINKITETPS